MKSILITGVSSGIGAVTTKYLIDRGYYIFGSVRSKADAERCKAEFGHSFHPLVFDVRDLDDIKGAFEQVKEVLGDENLYALVNNAGIAISGPIQFIDSSDIKDQFDINVIGLINTSQVFLPLLGGKQNNTKPSGRLINISSVAGTFSMPFQAPYSASKHAVESLTDAMRRELEIYGIKVISIRPGPVKSDIWKKELDKTKSYSNTIYNRIWSKKNDLISQKEKNAAPTLLVAKAVQKAIESKRPKLAYLVYGNPLLYYAIRILPPRWVDALIRQQFKKMNR